MPKFTIETIGCQMNVLDSELATAGLLMAGFTRTDDRREADVLLFNTCSIRQHAEDKIYSALGRLKQWKTQKPGGVVGVLGCMAQKEQKNIFRRAPVVDFVLGPGKLDKLSETIIRLLHEKKTNSTAARALHVSLSRRDNSHAAVRESFSCYDPGRISAARNQPFQAMVRVILGCNNFCTYCIVPYVRGPEQSRPPQEILREIRTLADQGVLEITLIGQTVNSYCYKNGEKTTRLSDLLYEISGVSGIRRVRFVTNYPRDMDDDLLQAVRDLPQVCEHLHVPAQSGNDAVLQRMNRHYTSADYLDLVDRVHETVPGASMTCDFIVGFCGETEEEFQDTANLVRYGRFKNSFIFKYSARPGTKAAEIMNDNVPESVKKRRNNELLKIQDEISLALNQEFVQKDVTILVENAVKRCDNGHWQLSGRTSCDRIVVFDSPDKSLIGTFQNLKIESAAPFTLFGSRSR